MTSASESILNPVKAKKIKMAVGSACELCGRDYPLRDLEIHLIQGGMFAEQAASDLCRNLLVLCPSCHYAIHDHRCPVKDQHHLVRYRSEGIAEAIRQILAHRPKPYRPPDVDMERIFYDATQIDMLYRVC